MSSFSLPDRALTLDDLAQLPPDDGNRYELIDGVLHVTTQPHWEHQYIVGEIARQLGNWNYQTSAGIVLSAPGVIFAPGDVAAPDVVWVRRDRLAHVLHRDGKLHAAPDLAVEVLSPGPVNQERDRIHKLAQYGRFGVAEYWIVDRWQRSVECYRPHQDQLVLALRAPADATLTAPLLPGFACSVAALLPPETPED